MSSRETSFDRSGAEGEGDRRRDGGAADGPPPGSEAASGNDGPPTAPPVGATETWTAATGTRKDDPGNEQLARAEQEKSDSADAQGVEPSGDAKETGDGPAGLPTTRSDESQGGAWPGVNDAPHDKDDDIRTHNVRETAPAADGDRTNERDVAG